MNEEKEMFSKLLKENGLTHGILNKFIKESKIEGSSFYSSMLTKVLTFREKLVEKEIIITELEDIFQRTTARSVNPNKKLNRKKVKEGQGAKA